MQPSAFHNTGAGIQTICMWYDIKCTLLCPCQVYDLSVVHLCDASKQNESELEQN